VFLERKITGRMHGEEFAEFSAILGWKALKDSVDQFGEDENGFTTLVPKLDGKDPDDAFSSVPYVYSSTAFTDNRKRGSICCTRFSRESAVQRSLNHSCPLISPISAINQSPPPNSRNSCTPGSLKITVQK